MDATEATRGLMRSERSREIFIAAEDNKIVMLVRNSKQEIPVTSAAEILLPGPRTLIDRMNHSR
jgi:hypothetical protein